jgi:hypothetical protein
MSSRTRAVCSDRSSTSSRTYANSTRRGTMSKPLSISGLRLAEVKVGVMQLRHPVVGSQPTATRPLGRIVAP